MIIFELDAIIYALTDYDDQIFYIGSTIQSLDQRMMGHLTEARHNRAYTNVLKNNKIRSLDYKIRIKEIDRMTVWGRNATCAQRSAILLERSWIKKFSEAGVQLCNRERIKKETHRTANIVS